MQQTSRKPLARKMEAVSAPASKPTRRRAQVVGINASKHRQQVIERRDELIESHAGLVKSIAERLLSRVPRSIELDDLVQTGMLALLRAATRYRPEAFDGVPFDAYARQRIRGAMLDSISGRNWIHATLEELSDPDRSRSISGFDDRGGEGLAMKHFNNPPQSIRTAPHPVEKALDDQRLAAQVADAIAYLTPEKQQLLRSYYRDGGTLEEAGAEIGLVSAKTGTGDRRRAGELLAEAIGELQRILHARR